MTNTGEKVVDACPSTEPEKQEDPVSASFHRLVRPHLLENLINDLGRAGIVGEPGNVVCIVLVYNSRLCEEPLNLAPQGESGIGKSVLVCKAGEVFESVAVVSGYLSRTSLIHDTDWAEKIDDNTYRIDLAGKILIILEAGSSREFLELFKPIRSHDKKRIIFSITEGKGVHATKKVVITGWPVFVSISVNPSSSEEDSTRDLSLVPAYSKAKGKAVNTQKAGRAAAPWKCPSDEELAETLQSWEYALTRMLRPGKVVNPFAVELARQFDTSNTRSMRDFSKLLSIFESSVLLHQFQRPIVKTSHGVRYVIGGLDDLRITAEIARLVIEPTAKGLGTDVIDAYEKFLREYCELPKTIKQIIEGWNAHYCKSISRSTLNEHYLYPLKNAGLLNEDESKKAHEWSTTSVGLSKSVGIDFDRLLEEASVSSGLREKIEEMLSSVDVSEVKYGDIVFDLTDTERLVDEVVSRIQTPTIRQEFLNKLSDPLSSCLKRERKISVDDAPTDDDTSDTFRRRIEKYRSAFRSFDPPCMSWELCEKYFKDLPWSDDFRKLQDCEMIELRVNPGNKSSFVWIERD